MSRHRYNVSASGRHKIDRIIELGGKKRRRRRGRKNIIYSWGSR